MKINEALKILDLKLGASENEIKKKYRSLAQKHHPDKNGGDDVEFKKIKEAYEVLTNPEKVEPEFSGAGMTPEEMMAAFHKARGRGNPFGGFDFNTENTSNWNSNTTVLAHITLEEAFRGVTKNVKLTVGIGSTTTTYTLPPGIRDGEIYSQLSKVGNIYKNVKIKVAVKPHSVFHLEGNNLEVETLGPLLDFYTGGIIPITDLAGNSFNVKLPAGSKTDTILRLKGKGFVDKDTGSRGDMLITVRAELPTLTEEQIEKLKEILT